MRRRKYNKIIIMALILLISIGFAYLSTTLYINGNANVYGNKWEIYFDNLIISENNINDTRPTIDTNKTKIDFETNLYKPGDYYEFYVDVVNDGSIDAMVKTITKKAYENNNEISIPSCIDFSVTYGDGNPLAVKHLLQKEDVITYKVKVEYKRDITEEELYTENKTIRFEFAVTYEQATKDAIRAASTKASICLANKDKTVSNDIVCKRATKLHAEICNNKCRYNGYADKEFIFYGNCGEEGVLKSGDAFDCDVNGDGNFTQEERFYYVSPKDADENSSYATLIYYKSVGNGQYYINNENSLGPQLLLNILPSDAEWSNVLLSDNGYRQIVNEDGNTAVRGNKTIQPFTYTNKASRLITSQEVEYACSPNNPVTDSWTENYLFNCDYILEKTFYSSSNNPSNFWLETPTRADRHLSGAGSVMYINQRMRLDQKLLYTSAEVKPVIEVPYSKMSY